MKATVTTVKGATAFLCTKCGDHVVLGMYAVAQTAMGHRLTHTHDCGAQHHVRTGKGDSYDITRIEEATA